MKRLCVPDRTSVSLDNRFDEQAICGYGRLVSFVGFAVARSPFAAR